MGRARNGEIELEYETFGPPDAGRSTHLDGVRPPSMLGGILRPSSAPYTLRDLADDAAAVLNAAG